MTLGPQHAHFKEIAAEASSLGSPSSKVKIS
jgi:hypothetical protein